MKSRFHNANFVKDTTEELEARLEKLLMRKYPKGRPEKVEAEIIKLREIITKRKPPQYVSKVDIEGLAKQRLERGENIKIKGCTKAAGCEALIHTPECPRSEESIVREALKTFTHNNLCILRRLVDEELDRRIRR